MVSITSPKFLNFHQWTAALVWDLADYNVPIPPPNAKYWQLWATGLLESNPAFSLMPYPTKWDWKKEEDWKLWAEYFVGMVYNIK